MGTGCRAALPGGAAGRVKTEPSPEPGPGRVLDHGRSQPAEGVPAGLGALAILAPLVIIGILLSSGARVRQFAAQTAQQGGRVKFTNPAYERKSSVWKAMYRAGKAPTAALSEFCNAWLKEL